MRLPRRGDEDGGGHSSQHGYRGHKVGATWLNTVRNTWKQQSLSIVPRHMTRSKLSVLSKKHPSPSSMRQSNCICAWASTHAMLTSRFEELPFYRTDWANKCESWSSPRVKRRKSPRRQVLTPSAATA